MADLTEKEEALEEEQPEQQAEAFAAEAETEVKAEEKKETRLVTDQGLNADEYSVSDPWVDSEKLDDGDEEEISGIEVAYDLKADEVKAALKAFQKKTIWKKNIIYTVLLAILAVLYLQAVIKKPDYTMGKILGLFSVCVIGFLWYLPAKHIKSTVQAVELAHDTFTIEICDIGFLIRENGGKYLIRYNQPMVSVIELPEVYLACVSREKMFAIPKRCVPEEKREEIVSLMKQGLGEKYTVAGK